MTQDVTAGEQTVPTKDTVFPQSETLVGLLDHTISATNNKLNPCLFLAPESPVYDVRHTSEIGSENKVIGPNQGIKQQLVNVRTPSYPQAIDQLNTKIRTNGNQKTNPPPFTPRHGCEAV